MSYWTERMQRADRKLDKSEADVDKRAKRFYERELKSLQQEIAEFYQRYGEDGVLRYRTMLREMDAKDRELLMRDCEEFARQHPELADMVEIRKDIYRLDRMEGLQANARLHLAQAAASSTEGLDGHFADAASEAVDAVAQAMGYGQSYHIFDDQVIRQFVGQQWSDGQSYSQKIWDDTRKVAQYVQKDLVDALIRGDSYSQIADRMKKRFDQSEYNVMRVVRTEGTYVARQAQGAAMVDRGIDTYYIDAVGDERTCDACGHADSDSHAEPYPFDGKVVGENYPPLHPNCRCQVNPGVADWDEWLRQRRAERRGVSAKVAEQPDAPEFEPAKTKKAATEYLKSFGFKKIGTALTLPELNQLGEAFTKAFARFPFMRGFASEIKTGRMGAAAYHAIQWSGSRARGVEFDAFYKFDRNNIASAERDAERLCEPSPVSGKPFWSKKSGLDGLVVHEMTHSVESYLTLRKMGITTGETVPADMADRFRFTYGDIADEVCREGFARAGVEYTDDNIGRYVSRYGASDAHECLAEAISCEDDSNAVCNAIKTVLSERIKEAQDATGTTL